MRVYKTCILKIWLYYYYILPYYCYYTLLVLVYFITIITSYYSYFTLPLYYYALSLYIVNYYHQIILYCYYLSAFPGSFFLVLIQCWGRRLSLQTIYFSALFIIDAFTENPINLLSKVYQLILFAFQTVLHSSTDLFDLTYLKVNKGIDQCVSITFENKCICWILVFP